MNDPHTPRSAWNPLAAFGLALGVVVAGLLAARALPEAVTTDYPWARQVVSQGLMLAVALGAMVLSRRPFAEFGFRRPVPAKGHFKLWGLVLGAASAGVILALGLRGMQSRLAGYGLLGIVLWIWVFSSIVEEIFCRGWFQSLVAGPSASDSTGNRTPAAVLWSTALFGTMHLSLLFLDINIAAVAVIVLAVTALGFVCATARARTGSLRPAIAAHVLFNVGGFVAGVIYTITYRIATGEMPSP
jgi:membrane protease YdiL (CAAX protease family)